MCESIVCNDLGVCACFIYSCRSTLSDDTCLVRRRIDLKVYLIQFTVIRTKEYCRYSYKCVLPELNIAESHLLAIFLNRNITNVQGKLKHSGVKCTCVTAKAPAPARPTSCEPATFYFTTVMFNIFKLNVFFNIDEISLASVNLKTKNKTTTTTKTLSPKKQD